MTFGSIATLVVELVEVLAVVVELLGVVDVFVLLAELARGEVSEEVEDVVVVLAA